MPTALRALIVEDSESDALLLVRALQRGGFDVTFERVDTAEAMRSALEREPWQVVLADHAMPHFSAPLALELLKGLHLDLPFIVVSGSIGEETAVEMMRAGAHDFVIKGKYTRLIPAIERELQDAGARAERARSQRLLESIIASSYDAIWSNARDGVILSWNPGATRIFGYSAVEVIGQNISILNPSGPPDQAGSVSEPPALHPPTGRFDALRRRKDGSLVEVSLTLSALQNERGETTGISVIARDISEAKESERKLVASLHEKEVLLKEIHHRVKNNLQVIASLLNLQARRVTDVASLQAIRESQSRVQAIALFHEKLYRSSDLAGIDAVEYLRDLVAAVFRSSAIDPGIRFQVGGDALRLGVDQAIPCGLMVNELVMNSLKHAFPEGRAGLVQVEFRGVQGGNGQIIISDDGVGLPHDLADRKRRSLGLGLVATLSDQLGGRLLTTSTGAGTRCEVVFPLAANGAS